MYRNSKDKRVHQTADMLYNAVRELVEEKKFSEIGIKEVCEKAGIGRSTFYRNFDYVEDVLSLEISKRFEEMLQQIGHQDSQLHQINMLPTYINYWAQHRSLLSLLHHSNQWGLFQAELHNSSVQGRINFQASAQLTDTQMAYLVANFQARIETLLHTWVSRDFQETPEQLAQLFQLPFVIARGLNVSDLTG